MVGQCSPLFSTLFVKVKVRSIAGTLAPLVKQLWVFLENDPPMAQDSARK